MEPIQGASELEGSPAHHGHWGCRSFHRKTALCFAFRPFRRRPPRGPSFQLSRIDHFSRPGPTSIERAVACGCWQTASFSSACQAPSNNSIVESLTISPNDSRPRGERPYNDPDCKTCTSPHPVNLIVRTVHCGSVELFYPSLFCIYRRDE